MLVCGKVLTYNSRTGYQMGTFGEELRLQRISRGIALEDITAVTKIAQRHLVALEQDRFRQLPGGILSKGIVRGYVGAIGLDERVWTDRFLRAATDVGQQTDTENGWTTFASNVCKERMERHEAMALRMRWMGAIVLMIAVAIGSFITVRYFGVRAGWWDSLLPVHATAAKAHALGVHVATWFRR
jgi:cytoskeleton protein RodZ